MTPEFSSPELQKAFAASRPFLESVDESRNRVSNDIKLLEAYLASILKAPFRHAFPKSLDGDDQDVHAAIELTGSASGRVIEEALLWDQDAMGRYRLLYERCSWDGYADVDIPGGPFFWEEATLQREVKPLIETKFELRKQMYAELPHFVTALARHLDIDGKGPELSDDSIPF